jgi:tRNA pseudouridine55 synthase
MFGILNINKPPGWTSRDVVNRVQRIVRPHKAGHVGTLDPLATGVLVVCVGAATRLIEYVQRQRKTYRGTFLLGRASDTEDITGEVRELADPSRPSRNELLQILPQFVGSIEQTPPAYSALKVQGQRAYDLARRGHTVELAPRTIEVFALRLVGYAYPEFVLDITCSGGTYVRSLGRDIAQRLGTAAVMSGLVRTAIGPFALSDSVELDELNSQNASSHLLPAALAVQGVPPLILTPQEQRQLILGQNIRRADASSEPAEFAAYDADGQLLGILARREGAILKPAKVFAAR